MLSRNSGDWEIGDNTGPDPPIRKICAILYGMEDLVQKLLVHFPLIIVAISLHEYAHALAAYGCGDDTPKRLGRLTINPLAHLDLFGTILLLVAGFGWGRPVPFDPRNLKNPKRDLFFIAGAGPFSNLILFGVALLSMKVIMGTEALYPLVKPLYFFAHINFTLFVFNMIPLPPLDGSKVLYSLLPEDMATRYEALVGPYGAFILMALFIFPEYTGLELLMGQSARFVYTAVQWVI